MEYLCSQRRVSSGSLTIQQTHTQRTHHEGIGGTHTVEAMVEGSKLFINRLIQQEVDVELDVLCGEKQQYSIS